MRMTIKAKLAAAFGAVLLLLGVIVYFGISGLNSFSDRVDHLIEDTVADSPEPFAVREPDRPTTSSCATSCSKPRTRSCKSSRTS